MYQKRNSSINPNLNDKSMMVEHHWHSPIHQKIRNKLNLNIDNELKNRQWDLVILKTCFNYLMLALWSQIFLLSFVSMEIYPNE